MIGQTDVDPLVRTSSLLDEVTDWQGLLEEDPDATEDLRRHTRTGRPLGSESFVRHVEAITGRTLRLRRPGRKRKK